jgi:hypothetical protein
VCVPIDLKSILSDLRRQVPKLTLGQRDRSLLNPGLGNRERRCLKLRIGTFAIVDERLGDYATNEAVRRLTEIPVFEELRDATCPISRLIGQVTRTAFLITNPTFAGFGPISRKDPAHDKRCHSLAKTDVFFVCDGDSRNRCR